jgi:EAL domain-containing protein (putative c-di-GMP-specific phosphodiesterase class I)
MAEIPQSNDAEGTSAIEQLGQGIATALAGLELHASSIHDATGDPVWISAGIVGPDEYSLLLDALDCFALEPARSCYERECGEGRSRLVFPVRDPRGMNRGAVMVEVTSLTLGGRGAEKALKPAFATLLRRLAMALADLTPAEEPLPHGTLGNSLTLYVQQLLKLRSSGRTRRYEVLLRSNAEDDPSEVAPRAVVERADAEGATGELDRHILGELIRWMKTHSDALEREPASFTINLSAGALRNPGFIEIVLGMLRQARLNPRLIGFELREKLCQIWPGDAERFVQACDKSGLQVVIDDFTFHSDVLPLLRYQAVRLLKIDAQLTVSALTDKVAQAKVVAIAQASKVLGAHCVAKRIESATARQWLTAIGVDFAQGFLLEGPLPLTELASLNLRTA